MTTGNELDDSAVIELTGKIMVVAVIVLFVVVVFVFFLHLYAKWFLRNRDTTTTINTTPIRPQLTTRGLDISILKSIPIVIFPTSTQQKEQGLECTVCLSQFSDGEKARLLPKCNHGFHVECIDMWFQSHSTCPICRNPLSLDLQPSNSSSFSSSVESRIEISSSQDDDVSLPLSTMDDESQVSQVSSFPTNVLFWGNETRVSNQIQTPPPQLPAPSSSTSTSSRRDDEAIIIEIPRQVIEDESNSNSKSPVPTPTRMSSFKRLLSRPVPSSSTSTSSRRENEAIVIEIPRQVIEDESNSNSKSPVPTPTRMRSFKRLLSRDTTRISPSVGHVEQVPRGQS